MSGVPRIIDQYLATLPADQREALESLRRTITSHVPEAEETISTRVPAVRYRGKLLMSFGAAKHHVSLFIMRGNVIKRFKDELRGYDVSNTVIRFTPDGPLPRSLLRRIIKARIAEIDGTEG